mmetsp:Transcript_69558/g.193542  ORF Transcript_69558/g.193542 Transcript_69558/m.193542 type:complete len:288 (-) Transcript_69558:1094-1957(-)
MQRRDNEMSSRTTARVPSEACSRSESLSPSLEQSAPGGPVWAREQRRCCQAVLFSRLRRSSSAKIPSPPTSAEAVGVSGNDVAALARSTSVETIGSSSRWGGASKDARTNSGLDAAAASAAGDQTSTDRRAEGATTLVLPPETASSCSNNAAAEARRRSSSASVCSLWDASHARSPDSRSPDSWFAWLQDSLLEISSSCTCASCCRRHLSLATVCRAARCRTRAWIIIAASCRRFSSINRNLLTIAAFSCRSCNARRSRRRQRALVRAATPRAKLWIRKAAATLRKV